MALRLSVRRADLTVGDTPLLALPLAKQATALAAPIQALDGALGGVISRALARKDFRGARDEVLLLPGSERGTQRVMLIGTGSASDETGAIRRAAAVAARQARRLGTGSLSWFDGARDAASIEAAAAGFHLGSWEYADLKTPPPEDESAGPTRRVRDPLRRRGRGGRGGARKRGGRRAGSGATAGHDARQSLHARLPRRHGARHRQAARDADHGARSRRNADGGNGRAARRRAGQRTGAALHRARASRRRRGGAAGVHRERGDASTPAASPSSRPRTWKR